MKNDSENKNNKIIFKKLYDIYGIHYYGWKGVINQFVYYYQKINHYFTPLKNSNGTPSDSSSKLSLRIHNTVKSDASNEKPIYKENIFFDEWIEKLLFWGNKIQSKEYLKTIKSKNYKLVTFLHNPPFLKLQDNEYKKNRSESMIINDKQLNKHILNKLHDQLKDHLEFLYVLSNDHKKYIYNNYPYLQNKIVSVYHPMNMKLENSEKKFNFDLFKKTKNIFHIGWWLRNFKTFIDFVPADGYTKNILIKGDFKTEWDNHILKHNKVENINIIDELSNEKYLKIFENSCIFIDLEDAVANNVILECLKFNTPFITRYNKSIEEYVGFDYPLYFENVDELQILSDNDIFLTAVKDAHKYLKNLNKNHIELNTFNKKISYDLNKLKIKIYKHKLTWLCILIDKNYFQLIDNVIDCFMNQENIDQLQLVFINLTLIKMNELNEKINFQYNNIYMLDLENPNEYIKNLNTEYILMVNLNDKYKTNYSTFCMKYLDDHLNNDVIFSSFTHLNISNVEGQPLPINEMNGHAFKDASPISNLHRCKNTNKNIKSKIRDDKDEDQDNHCNKYKKGMYFIEDIERIYMKEKGTLPYSGYVFRKSMVELLDMPFIFMKNKDMYEYFIRNHLNLFCISEKSLFISY